jgi:hypothetical protein
MPAEGANGAIHKQPGAECGGKSDHNGEAFHGVPSLHERRLLLTVTRASVTSPQACAFAIGAHRSPDCAAPLPNRPSTGSKGASGRRGWKGEERGWPTSIPRPRMRSNRGRMDRFWNAGRSSKESRPDCAYEHKRPHREPVRPRTGKRAGLAVSEPWQVSPLGPGNGTLLSERRQAASAITLKSVVPAGCYKTVLPNWVVAEREGRRGGGLKSLRRAVFALAGYGNSIDDGLLDLSCRGARPMSMVQPEQPPGDPPSGANHSLPPVPGAPPKPICVAIGALMAPG